VARIGRQHPADLASRAGVTSPMRRMKAGPAALKLIQSPL
jgi:hypothetical protein